MKNKRAKGKKVQMLTLIGISIVLIMFGIGTAYAERIVVDSQIKNDIVPKSINMACSGILTTDINSGLTPTNLVNNLLGGGIDASNIQFKGANIAAGTFTCGAGIIGFGSGVILSSGDIKNVKGPNILDGISTTNGKPGDPDLNSLVPGSTTNDASVLEFDFVPATNQLEFRYVFSSDEYNEYVNTEYNDVFGFFVNGVNVALIPGTTTPVSINNVNCGGPIYGTNPKNCDRYINNDLNDSGGSINTEMDGLTEVFIATANVNAGQINHIKLAIADVGDGMLDSNVFIEAGSFKSYQLTLEPQSATNYVGESHQLTATLVDGNGYPVSGQEITFTVTDGPHVDMSGFGTTGSDGKATWSYIGTTVGVDTIVATGYGQTSNSVQKTWEQQSLSIVLTPATAKNPVDTAHTVTATVKNSAGTPQSGVTVDWSIISGPNSPLVDSGVTNAKGQTTFTYTGSGGVGTDSIQASITVNEQTILSNIVKKEWTQSLSIVLTPATAKNLVNTKHTVTATVKNSVGIPQSGVTVDWSIISGPNHPLVDSGVTNAKGQTTFTYTGSGGVGTDSIRASMVVNGVKILSNIVKKEWTPNGDILAYYRKLGQYPNIVETIDLLKAADDWRDNIIPPGFSVSITTDQLLTLADEWRNS